MSIKITISASLITCFSLACGSADQYSDRSSTPENFTTSSFEPEISVGDREISVAIPEGSLPKDFDSLSEVEQQSYFQSVVDRSAEINGFAAVQFKSVTRSENCKEKSVTRQSGKTIYKIKCNNESVYDGIVWPSIP